MKKVIALLMVVMPFILNAQKITFQGDTLLVDQKPYCILVKDGCKFLQSCQYLVKNLNGDLMLTIKYEDYQDQMIGMNGTLQTTVVGCANFNFLTTKTVAQVKDFTQRIEKVGKEIYNNQFFKDGKFNNEAPTNFVFTNPVVYPKQPPTTIVINQPTNPSQENYNTPINRNCNWVDGQDASLNIDRGRGVTDWNVHYVYAENTNEIYTCASYLGNRLSSLTSCLELNTYAKMYADVSIKIASYGISYAGWRDGQDPFNNSDPGRGVTVWVEHYNHVKDNGNADVSSTVINRLNILSNRLTRENYAKLYADVSVIVARYGVNGSRIINSYQSSPDYNCIWIDGQDYNNPGDEGRGVSSWEAHYNNGINLNQVNELGGLIRKRLVSLKLCLDLNTYAKLYGDIAIKIADYGVRYSGWVDGQDPLFPQDPGRGVTVWIEHFNAVKNGGNAEIPRLVDKRINALLFTLSRENFARLYADVSVIIARYGVNKKY